MATKKNVGGIIRVPLKANATINANGIVCTDSSGFAVPGADTSGLKFVGMAKTGGANTKQGNANGDVVIQVYTIGSFLMTATSIAQSNVGDIMYAAGAATIDDTATNHIIVGRLVGFVSATKGWVDIGVSASGNAGDKGATGDKGAAGDKGVTGDKGPGGDGAAAATITLADAENRFTATNVEAAFAELEARVYALESH